MLGTITSSSFLRLRIINANNKASVPEAHPTEYLIPESLENSFSKRLTALPKIKSGDMIDESLDVEKIYTSSKVVQSIESELEFRNKDIIIHKLLLDLGKIGASDIQGKVITDQKYTKLYFDQNFYLDNNRIFFNRFNLRNFSEINNLNFVGEINLSNFLLKLNSVSSEEELSLENLRIIKNNALELQQSIQT